MDLGPGPPEQSPEDYLVRERRERTGVAAGVAVGVFLLFAVPLGLLCYANWRRRRRFQENNRYDLEGTTVVSQDGKGDTTLRTCTDGTMFTTTVLDNESSDLAEWEREKRQLGSSCKPSAHPTTGAPKQVTTEEVLGLDKPSFLRNLPIGGNLRPADGSPATADHITVLPSQIPHIALPKSKGESSKQREGSSDADDCISPWMVEHEPNPVIFKHLLGSNNKNLDTEKDLDNPSPSNEEIAQQHPNQSPSLPQDGNSKEVSPSGETSSSSPSNSESQDSTSPLMSHKSPEHHLQSAKTKQNVFQQFVTGPGSEQITTKQAGNACSHCKRTFKTTGQLNAHIHRKHVRRYSCSICSNTFHLKTDLKRHERTVHRDHLASESRGFRCTNPGCSIPDKIFIRRDNFDRHVARCARRVENEEPQKMEE